MLGPAAAALIWACLVRTAPAQLVINVRNAGGDLLRERLLANTSDETITLEFQRADGTHVTQLIDFRAEVQVFRVVVLAEEEVDQARRRQQQPQVLCFLTRFNRLGFISVDAMSKLRQRNPLAEREPEDDRGRELVQLDLSVDLSHAELISPHVAALCADASQATFARQEDLQAWAASPSRAALGQDPLLLATAVRPAPSASVRCGSVGRHSGPPAPCGCRLQLCVAWFPCGLKWCRDTKRAAFRCGIRSCRKCREFRFPVLDRALCPWDDDTAAS
ncbi:BRICHOS-like domain-containing protein out at first isoform X1 [Haemaphysalis longicornis]